MADLELRASPVAIVPDKLQTLIIATVTTCACSVIQKEDIQVGNGLEQIVGVNTTIKWYVEKPGKPPIYKSLAIMLTILIQAS
jgi:hypothetical protein